MKPSESNASRAASRRPGAKHPDGDHCWDVSTSHSVMELHFIEDRQEIILGSPSPLEQRQSGCERISLLWGVLLPNPS